jgi:hypothetical protein
MAQDEQDEPVPFQAIAERFGRQEPAEDEVRTRLGATRIVLDGYGSIGRPMSEELAQWGVCRFVIADPKSYVPQSVWSQCTSQEVGRLKVDVGGERLRALGAEVASYARDINSVPEGVVTPGSIVVTTVDNRRADIVSNRRAARMGARLIKVNVEPTLGVVAVRAYGFRRETRLCVECQFGDHHYAAQRHPQSCDGSSDGRRTNSPRWLSQTAARLGAMVAADLAAEHPAARDWIAHEWQYTPRSGHVRGSQLEPNGHCRWDHAVRWENVVRTTEGPKSLSLQSLFRAAKLDVDVQAKIRFCQQIALRGRCRGCRCDFAVVRWFCDLRSPVGVCPSCGGVLLAIPFAVFREASLESLLPVLDPPLEAWGVEPLAVMELSRHDRRTTFVVGGGQCG